MLLTTNNCYYQHYNIHLFLKRQCPLYPKPPNNLSTRKQNSSDNFDCKNETNQNRQIKIKQMTTLSSVTYLLQCRAHLLFKMVVSMERWKGKVAVVTGASAGIGAAIVETLVNNGIIVAGIARRKQRVEELSKQLKDKSGKLYAVEGDISKEEDIIKAFTWITKNLGHIHILINNAGVLANTSLIDGDTSQWKNVFDVNVLGLCIATREAIRNMKINKIDGHIIHINSTAGHRVPPYFPNINVYPASKYAVTALTETLRQELAACGSKIKISSVSPGPVDTDMVKEARSTLKELDEVFKSALKPEDIADGIIYVLSTPPSVQVHELTIRPVGHKM